MKIFKVTFVILSVALVGLIFYFVFLHRQASTVDSFIQPTSPTPAQVYSPAPTIQPINQDTNLEEAVKKLVPDDFSKDFNNLEQSVN